jgi:hypothetical protein
MGFGSGGSMRALDGRVQMNPALFQGKGKGDTPAAEAGVRNPEAFFKYNSASENIGATKENLSAAQIKERDQMGVLGKSIWDFVNKRYMDHKNDIQQVSWGIANDGRISVKGNASLGDINNFVKENNKEFSKLLDNLKHPTAGVATKAENRITGLLTQFLGRVSLPTRGQIFAETHNQLASIRNTTAEIRGYIARGQWNKVATFKPTKETKWANSYVKTAKALMKNAKNQNGKIVARQGRSNTVKQKLDALSKLREKGNKSTNAISLARLGANISRLNAQMRETSNRARQFGTPLATNQKGVATYKAQLTQHVREMVKGIRKDTGLKNIKAERIISELKKETQNRRGRQA